MAVTTTPQTGGEARKVGDAGPRRIGGGLLDPKILWKSTPAAFAKLDPRVQIKNPVMFVVEIGAAVTTYTAITGPASSRVFNWTIVVWLWLTVVFANLAEAVAEGRGKAQADTLRRATVSRLVRRRVSACALPRPSATASARLANSTVSHSQTTIVQLKIDGLVIAV